MGSFRKVGETTLCSNKPGFQDKFITYRWPQMTVEVNSGTLKRTFISSRGVAYGADGCVVVPYFHDPFDNRWKIVMVKQFRVAVESETIEPAGGRISEDPLICFSKDLAKNAMAREMEEEIGLVVHPSKIKIVLVEWILNSLLNNTFFGGIVQINSEDIPEDGIRGEWGLCEYSINCIFDLTDILKDRDDGRKKFDLISSRMLDEVAKEVGILKISY